MQAEQPTPPRADRRIAAEQTSLLYTNLPLGLAGTFVIAGILSYGMVGAVDSRVVLAWFLVMVATCAARFMLVLAYRRRPPAEADDARWLRRFEIGTFASGTVWGMSAVVLFPLHSLPHQVFMGFVLASMAAGAVSTLGMHLRAYAVYLVPALLPYTILLFRTGGELQYSMGFVFALGQVVLFISARRFEKVTVRALSLRYENNELVSRLRNAVTAAEEASRAKSLFLANISQELCTPLDGVITMNKLLAKTTLDERQRRLVTSSGQSAQSVLTVVTDIIDMARLDTGRLVLEAQDFDLRDCIEGAVELVATEARRKGLNLTLETPSKGLPQLLGDPLRVHQIWFNLVANAVRHTLQGEITVKLVLRRLPTTWRIEGEVIDTGVGVPPERLALINQPLVGSETSISKLLDGGALGLPIARRLIEMMGGEMRVESEAGKGAKVHFWIALAESKAMAQATLAHQIPLGTRLLVLDARTTSRDQMRRHLVKEGAVVTAAASATAAWASLFGAVANGPYDALLVDMTAGEEESHKLVETLRADERFARLKVIAIDWLASEADHLASGCDAIVSKPVRYDRLLKCVAMVVAGPDQQSSDEAEAAEQGPVAGARVVVASADPLLSIVVDDHLRMLGVTPEYIDRGADAFTRLMKGQVDLLLVDKDLPGGLTGAEVTRRLRAEELRCNRRPIPVVMMTADRNASSSPDCMEAGINDFLVKPIEEARLAIVLRRWLKRTPVVERDARKAEVTAAAA